MWVGERLNSSPLFMGSFSLVLPSCGFLESEDRATPGHSRWASVPIPPTLCFLEKTLYLPLD